MGRSSKSVFKTLISSVKSFNKEKKEPSDKVQTTRKGHQGRCMWSLGKSSSRSSEDMDMEEIKYVQIQKEPEQEANLEQVLDNLEAVEEIKVVHKVEVEKEKEKEKEKVEVDKLKVEVEEEFEEQKELDNEEIEEQKELDNEESKEQKERDKEEEEPEEQIERDKEELEEQKELVKEEFEAQKELDNEEFEEQKELDKEEFEEQKELEKVELEEQKVSDEVYLNELEDQKGITQQKESLLLVIRATLKIQAAFRHHLARRRAVQALKALVRLQALVRGRIVRRAMVRLRCINALIKVQSIVRGYLVRKSDIGLMVQRHLNQTKQLRIETEQGDIYNTITNDEVEEQHDEVPYNNGKEMGHHTFKTTVTVKQEVIGDQGDSVRGSINVGSVYNRPYVDTLLLKQEENLKKVIICNEDDDDDVSSSITKDVVEDPGSCSSAMSFSMKDEDECSELSISMKEQEECSELSFPMKEQEEIGIASAFSSSSEAITMQPAAIPSLTPPPTLSSIPNATLENFSIGGTNITTPIQVGGPGVNGDTMQVSRNDLVAIMPEQPRPSVSDDNEHIKAKSSYGSANCGTYLAVTDLRFIKDAMHEQNDSLMRSKQEQGECDAMNSRLIDEVTNKHMGTAMNSKEEEEPESPSLRLVVPNYMATTKSSKAKKVVGSPKPMKTDPLGLRADSLNHIQDFLKPRQDSPKLRQASPKLRQDSPKMKHNSPKPRLDSPKMRLDSPKHNKQEDSPKHKQDSPNLVKIDPLSMKRRHSLSVLEGKSGLSSLTQKSVL